MLALYTFQSSLTAIFLFNFVFFNIVSDQFCCKPPGTLNVSSHDEKTQGLRFPFARKKTPCVIHESSCRKTATLPALTVDSGYIFYRFPQLTTVVECLSIRTALLLACPLMYETFEYLLCGRQNTVQAKAFCNPTLFKNVYLWDVAYVGLRQRKHEQNVWQLHW